MGPHSNGHDPWQLRTKGSSLFSGPLEGRGVKQLGPEPGEHVQLDPRAAPSPIAQQQLMIRPRYRPQAGSVLGKYT